MFAAALGSMRSNLAVAEKRRAAAMHATNAQYEIAIIIRLLACV